MRKLFAASFAAFALLAAGSAHAQSGPTLPNWIDPSTVLGIAPNGAGGFDWIVRGADGDPWLEQSHPDGSWAKSVHIFPRSPEAPKTAYSRHRVEQTASRASAGTLPYSVSFTSWSHH